jgi:DNA helicase-2/ATP-dependent DNA helicase PcrA
MWKNAAGYLNPFVDVARGTGRGPGWARASAQGGFKPGQAVLEGRAITIADTKPSVYRVADRVFHEKFGYGIVQQVDGNKLHVQFDTSGLKSIMDSFVVAA